MPPSPRPASEGTEMLESAIASYRSWSGSRQVQRPSRGRNRCLSVPMNSFTPSVLLPRTSTANRWESSLQSSCKRYTHGEPVRPHARGTQFEHRRCVHPFLSTTVALPKWPPGLVLLGVSAAPLWEAPSRRARRPAHDGNSGVWYELLFIGRGEYLRDGRRAPRRYARCSALSAE